MLQYSYAASKAAAVHIAGCSHQQLGCRQHCLPADDVMLNNENPKLI